MDHTGGSGIREIPDKPANRVQPYDRLPAVRRPVGQVEGRPEEERETSGAEDRRRLLMVGENQHGSEDERSDTRHQGEHPAEELGERDLPLHGRSPR